MSRLAHRTNDLVQSNIRAVTLLLKETGGINLGQGICDMPTPEPIKRAAKQAIDDNESVYSYYGGIDALREALVEKARTYNRIPVPSPDGVMVSVGSTGAFVATILALLDPGDEILVFEPYYGYHVHLLAALGIRVRFVRTTPPEWSIPFDLVRDAIGPKTRAVLVNTPGNPNGKVWSEDELGRLATMLNEFDLYAITDEIYEYMLYDGRTHVSLASLPEAFDRTVTISGFSKTYNMTGWRIGYAVGPESVIGPMGLLSDLIYICAPTPLQHGVAEAFRMSDEYFEELATSYDRKRTLMCQTLESVGFNVPWPQGSYYVLADFSPLRDRFDGFEDDSLACKTLVKEAGVGTVPGHSFYSNPVDGASLLRFCFAKEYPILETACRQLVQAFG